MKTVDMIDKYHDNMIVDKNKMFKIEVPAWYLKDIMELISERYISEWQKGSMEWNPIFHKMERQETAVSKRWNWIYNFIKKQIKEQ